MPVSGLSPTFPNPFSVALIVLFLLGWSACAPLPSAARMPSVPSMPEPAQAPSGEGGKAQRSSPAQTAPDTPKTAEGAAEVEARQQVPAGSAERDSGRSPKAGPTTADYVYVDHIRSVRLHPSGEVLEPPIIGLGSGEQLDLMFDDLAENVRPYRMVLYHCDRFWKRSDLDFYDYLRGFDRVNLNEYTFSTLGKTRFVQYRYRFPNPDCQPLLSGNYLLLVYDENNPDQAVLTRRFYVTEKEVGVTASVQRPASPKYRSTHQQLRVEVRTQDLESSNPMAQIGLTLLQNMRPDNAKVDLKPDFLREGSLSYQSPDLVFAAGKEWRFGSMRSTRLLTEGVQRIDRDADPPILYLRHDEVRSFLQYRYRADMNGDWFVAVDDNGPNTDADQDEREAEYVRVKFFLRYPAPLNDGTMHLFAGFDDFRLDGQTEMRYNLDRGGYEAERVLKQGVYNWQYAFVPFASGEPDSDDSGSSPTKASVQRTPVADLSVVEGNWFETENRYEALVYFRDFRLRCDRLIGHASFRSLP